MGDLRPVRLPDHDALTLSDEDIRGFGPSRNIFLSPHFDDICFSLGSFVSRVRSGTLVNIFTRGTHALAFPPELARTVENVHRLRDAEDRHFAEKVGLARVDLALEEPSITGRDSRDLSHLAEDRSRLDGPLLRLLADMSRGAGERINLFCPIGIGDHANHVAVESLVCENFSRGGPFRVLFYEDLPYAASNSWRRIGLRRLLASFSGRTAIRYTVPIGDRDEKLRLIACYPSQTAERSLDRFSLADGRMHGPHEAFWEFTA